jgi:hypothetical protein
MPDLLLIQLFIILLVQIANKVPDLLLIYSFIYYFTGTDCK